MQRGGLDQERGAPGDELQDPHVRHLPGDLGGGHRNGRSSAHRPHAGHAQLLQLLRLDRGSGRGAGALRPKGLCRHQGQGVDHTSLRVRDGQQDGPHTEDEG